MYPNYGPGYKSKIVLPSVIDSDSFRLYSVVIMAPDSTQAKHRLTPESYLGIVAATNFKQRIRKMLEYYHADRLNYVVTGTPNRLEYDQGFFVKLGDGAADVKPIAHLYKSQVYALAEYLGVPEQIRSRPPTTDTYSLPQSQEEFYFALPYDLMDLCLFGKNNGVPVEDIAAATGLTVGQVNRVLRDIDRNARPRSICTSARSWPTTSRRSRTRSSPDRPEPWPATQRHSGLLRSVRHCGLSPPTHADQRRCRRPTGPGTRRSFRRVRSDPSPTTSPRGAGQ